jgi:signal transduction histidine kinase
LRWRLAALFVALSSVVYVSLTLFSLVIFHTMMMTALDNELRGYASSFGHAIDLKGDTPYFRDWIRTVRTEPARSLITIQLYDKNKRLLENYGPNGYAQLLPSAGSVDFNGRQLLVRTTELTRNNRLVGYMQLELPTNPVDEATHKFGLTMAVTAPLVLAGLAVVSLVVSGQVARPFIKSMNMLRRFVADAGHELNTPLSIMQARMDSLSKKLNKQNVSTDELLPIERSLEHMGKIVRDLMLLTEVEGPLAARTLQAPIDLDALVSKEMEDFRDRFAAKQIELRYEPAPAHVPGFADALQRLLSNLLENALRYTDSGGHVSVQLRRTEKNVVLVVADNGIGIPSESLSLIFDRFYRVDKSRSRESGGVGLGLSIVKAIAEAHKGSVAVQSKLGEGSTFTVTLPAV